MTDTNGPNNDAKGKFLNLVHQLREADLAYYRDDDPVLSDNQYDSLRRETLKWIDADPTLGEFWPERDDVGAETKSDFVKQDHLSPMLSLDNLFDAAGLAAFYERIRSFLQLDENTQIPLHCEPKIDGVSLNLIYRNGRLTDAITRGNGRVGERVLQNALRITSIPTRLGLAQPPETIEIRGEVFQDKAAFEAMNGALLAQEQKPFANPRNAAAGTLRQLDSDVVEARDLTFIAYANGTNVGKSFAAQSEFVLWLADVGFKTNPLNAVCLDEDAVWDYYKNLNGKRAALDYEIDGLVYKVDDIGLQKRLGLGRRAPRWAIAHKFPAEKIGTRVEAIDIQVGRTGTLTPVARVAPVLVGGVTVSNVTLHNEDEIARKDIRIGDEVIVQRAGDVIPQIVEVVTSNAHSARAAAFSFPTRCPKCGAPALRDEAIGISEVRRRCSNTATCPAQVEGRLIHFVSKAGLDIDGFGAKQVSLFVEKGVVAKPSDIFNLAELIEAAALPSLAQWSGFGETSAQKLFESIEASKYPRFDVLLAALSIRHIGKSNALMIAQYFGVWREFSAFVTAIETSQDVVQEDLIEKLVQIDGIGPTQARSLYGYFRDADNFAEFKCLESILTISDFAIPDSDHALSGKKIVFTGTLAKIKRDEAKTRAQACGAIVTSSLSKQTDYLIAGDKAGSKRKKAEDLGVAILNEEAFLTML